MKMLVLFLVLLSSNSYSQDQCESISRLEQRLENLKEECGEESTQTRSTTTTTTTVPSRVEKCSIDAFDEVFYDLTRESVVKACVRAGNLRSYCVQMVTCE